MINTEHVIRHRLLFAVLAGGLWAGQLLAGPATRTVDRLQTEARGMYLLWAENRADQEELLQLPFVRGGQVTIQWADVERKPGVYDFAEIEKLNQLLQSMSHCGLGHTACNPVLDTIARFRPAYERRLAQKDFVPAFDLDQALAAARQMTGRDDPGAHIIKEEFGEDA